MRVNNKIPAILVILLCLAICRPTVGQEIDFSQFGTYPLTVFKDQDLNFGNVMYQEGLISIDLASPDKVTVSISGVEFLDVIVEVTSDQELLLNGNPSYSGDPSRSIPFTLEAAFQNRGLPPSNVGASELFTITNNMGMEQIRIEQRNSGPPGPPPTPPHDGYTPPESTAYVYIYGSINVGAVAAGIYTGMINVRITYN